MSKSSKKVVSARDKKKMITRAKAEKLLGSGAEPSQFASHPNYHIRRKSWTLMGKPLPSDPTERAKFLETLHVKEEVSSVT